MISGSPTVCRIFHSFSTVNADTTAAIQALNATTQQSEYNAMLSTTWQLAELKPDLAGLFDSSTVNVFCGLYTGASRDFQGPGCPYFNPTVSPNLPPAGNIFTSWFQLVTRKETFVDEAGRSATALTLTLHLKPCLAQWLPARCSRRDRAAGPLTSRHGTARLTTRRTLPSVAAQTAQMGAPSNMLCSY